MSEREGKGRPITITLSLMDCENLYWGIGSGKSMIEKNIRDDFTVQSIILGAIREIQDK